MAGSLLRCKWRYMVLRLGHRYGTARDLIFQNFKFELLVVVPPHRARKYEIWRQFDPENSKNKGLLTS